MKDLITNVPLLVLCNRIPMPAVTDEVLEFV